MSRLWAPADIDRALRSLRREIDFLMDEHDRAALYHWAHSGLDGLRSPLTGSHASSGHGDPTARQAALQAVQAVETAGAQIVAAHDAVRSARRLLTPPDRPTPDGPPSRGWVPKDELQTLKKKATHRKRNGDGYGRT